MLELDIERARRCQELLQDLQLEVAALSDLVIVAMVPQSAEAAGAWGKSRLAQTPNEGVPSSARKRVNSRCLPTGISWSLYRE